MNQKGQELDALAIPPLINDQRVADMIVQLVGACSLIRVEPDSLNNSVNTTWDTRNTNAQHYCAAIPFFLNVDLGTT